VTLVGENEEKANTIQPPFLCFSHLQLVSEPWFVVLTLNSVIEKDLRKTYLLKTPLPVETTMLYHMIMVTRKLNLEKKIELLF